MAKTLLTAGPRGRRPRRGDVSDVAAGDLLADEREAVGERYILGGRNFTFDRLFADLGRLSGRGAAHGVPRRMAAIAASVLAIGPGIVRAQRSSRSNTESPEPRSQRVGGALGAAARLVRIK